jgi:hypothetical protein
MRILDTLKYARRLEGAGIAREHAEAHATVMTEMILTEVATKQDIELAIAPLAREIERLRDEIGRVQDRMTIRLGAIVVIGIGALTAIQRLT